MPTKRPPLAVIVILAAALIAAGYFAYSTYFRPAERGALTASGTVEATEITLAPELAGKVIEVLVKEGQLVQAGDVLFRLDDSLLQAQRGVAAAALDTAQAAARTAEAAAGAAQAQVDLTLMAALAEQKPARSADWTASQPAEFNQPAWYFETSEQLASAQTEAAAAQAALDAAHSKLAAVQEKAASGDFVAAEKRVTDARSAFIVAQNVLAASAPLHAAQPATATLSAPTSLTTSQDLRDAAQTNYDQAASELKNAQTDYVQASTTTGAQDVLSARAELRVAQERLDAALDRVRALQTGRLSPKVVAAQKALDQALAAAAQAKTAAAQAQANLALVDTQIGKLTVTAPTDGLVLTRAIEPGEVVMPGSSLLTLARLSDLSITVYVPEDRYGELSLGQAADITVDSFPGRTFSGAIADISSRAEFTPRNVQTAAGRKTTVFAIQLSLADAAGQLKPGMPADVAFK